MTECKFYIGIWDYCGINNHESDYYQGGEEPDGQVDGVCQDCSNESCSHFEELL